MYQSPNHTPTTAILLRLIHHDTFHTFGLREAIVDQRYNSVREVAMPYGVVYIETRMRRRKTR